MADQRTIRESVDAVKAGASNYLTYPIDPTEVGYVIESLLEDRKRQSELDYLRDQFWDKESLHFAKTQSPTMAKVFDKIRSVSSTRTTVMLYGETGTGKGVIAKLIHRSSNRRQKQFISIHCGAIPDTLLESELYGHEKGAFTGADKRKPGKFEIAHGGTIFLDEVGTITASAQIKLLQVLQDRTFQRVGGQVTLESDARVVAATNADLKKMSEAGEFRKDLYYRLNVFPIEVPALRDRREDVPLLVDFFLDRLNTLYDKEIRKVHPMVMEALKTYDWPGNIRELENLMERSYILESTPVLSPESFPGELFAANTACAQVPFNSHQGLAEVRARGVENIERQYLKEVLSVNRGRIDKSAREAGISTRQLHKLLKKYDIRKEDHKS
ncbi:MAG: sigma-54-dependent Fis family transcriptional regulator [Desulfobacterales bacterium]|nr:sigma-54-dependent Fis family transcriptional regulator [Desulfobacterales bacterium]